LKYFKGTLAGRGGGQNWRKLEPSYGSLHVKDKVVVVVGADCGSTHLYFLLRGAKYVIGYEKDERLRGAWKEVCAHFNLCNHGEIRGK